MHEIEIPFLEYTRESISEFCNKFGCTLLPKKKHHCGLRIQSADPLNFFWLGMNLTLFIDNGVSVSAASKILKSK